MKGLKIHIILLACVVTLAVVLPGQRILHQRRVEEPLLEQIRQIPGVTDARLKVNGDRQSLVLELDADADLRNSYVAARGLAQKRLGEALQGVEIRDNRDQSLIDSFYLMHFYVQQGIATGLFTTMADGIDAIADQTGLAYHRVFVDGDNVYLQLCRGDRHLYEIIARPQIVAQEQYERRAVRTW